MQIVETKPFPRTKVTDCLKRKGKSEKYKYVYKYESPFGLVKWRMHVSAGGHTSGKYYDSEIQAAKAVDLFLIRLGKKPVNLLKPL